MNANEEAVEKTREYIEQRAENGKSYLMAKHVYQNTDVNPICAGQALRELRGDVVEVYRDSQHPTYKITV